MKRIFSKLLVLFAFALFVPNVFASDLTNDLTLESDSTECYVVKSGSDIMIDLNNHNITCADKDAIYVENGAKLTVVGKGTVQSEANGKSALFNNGDVTLNGGTFTADNQKTAYYSILNHGVMTINEGVTVSQTNYKTSSLFDNGYHNYTSKNERQGYVKGYGIEKPTLTINGGVFDGGMNTIKNDDNGVLEINDGHFINNVQVAVMNWNEAVINGGVFEVPTGNDKTTLFLGSYGKDTVDKGILEINGGTFNGEFVVEFMKGKTSDAKLTVTDGIFNSLTSFVNESGRPKLSDLGSVSITGGVFTDISVTPDEGYNLVSIDRDYNKDGVNDVLVSEVELIPTIEVSLKVDETYDTKLSKDIMKYGTWTSTDESVATVKEGIITGHKKGNATIKVKFGSDTKTYDVSVLRHQVVMPTVDGKLEYTGKDQTVVLKNYDEELMTLTNETGKDVNKYTTQVSLKNTVKYEWVNGKDEAIELSWNIEKAKVTLPKLNPSTYEFTNKDITPTVDGYDEKIMTVSGDVKAQNLGSYTLVYTLKDTDNYEWESESEKVELTWTISKAGLKKPTLKTTTYAYTGKEVTPVLEGVNEELMTVSGITVGSPVGPYTIKISLNDKEHYTWDDGTTDDVELVWTISFGVPELEATSTYNSIKLTWTSIDGADGYQVYRCNSKGKSCTKLTTTEKLSYKDKKLKFDKKYYYKVRAYRIEDGSKINGKYSELLTKKTALNAATITVSTNRYKNILVEWGKVSGAERYYVYRCDKEGKNCEKQGFAYDTDFINTTPEEGVNYTYKVRTYRAGVYGPYSELVQGLRLDDTIKYSVNNTAYKTNTIKITNVETAKKYIIYRATSKNGTYKKIKTLKSTGENLVYEDTDVSFNKKYYYRVKINNGINDSDYSSKKSVTTTNIATPTFTYETTGSYVTINIDKVKGATGYQIAYSTDNKTFTSLVKTDELSYDKRLNDNEYFFKVRAYRKVGSKYYYSDYSTVETIGVWTEK